MEENKLVIIRVRGGIFTGPGQQRFGHHIPVKLDGDGCNRRIKGLRVTWGVEDA